MPGDEEADDGAEHQVDIGLHAPPAGMQAAPPVLQGRQGADAGQDQGPEEKGSIESRPEPRELEKEGQVLVGIPPDIFVVVAPREEPPDQGA